MASSAHLFIALAVCSAKYLTAFAPSPKHHQFHTKPPRATNPEPDLDATSNTQMILNDPTCPVEDEDCLAIYEQNELHSDTTLLQSLQRRSRYIKREPILKNWESGVCPTTKVSISSSDAVRRVCMDHYPLAACGSASGSVYLVDLEEQRVMSSVQGHVSINSDAKGASSDEVKKQAMEKLYGKLDGGGVISIAMRDGVVASSGREGGVKLWSIDDEFGDTDMQLVPLGSLATLQHTIVTSIKFDSAGLLWVSCYDGTVRCYDLSQNQNDVGSSDEKKLFKPLAPIHMTEFTDSVLDMFLCEELNIGVCATSDGQAALFSLDDGQFFVGIMLFGVGARSVSIVKYENEDEVDMTGKKQSVSGYCVLCGGMDGTIHRIPLNVDSTGEIDMQNPFAVNDETKTAIKPRHTGPVMCLASPGDGVFVTGGQDGALRVWRIDGLEEVTENDDLAEAKQQPVPLAKCKCMYALTGYKLWLGSACTDGDKLVSDGGENNIIVRDYSKDNGLV